MLICGAVNFIASLPFWFLPYSLPKEGENENLKISHLSVQGDPCKIEPPAQPQLKFSDAVKGEILLPKYLHVNSVLWIHCELSMDSHNLQQVQVSAVQTIDRNIFNLCHCNYMLKASFSPLLMSESWEKPVLFSEHQRCSVGSCEVMCDSYSPMVMKREWEKHPIPH